MYTQVQADLQRKLAEVTRFGVAAPPPAGHNLTHAVCFDSTSRRLDVVTGAGAPASRSRA